MRISLGEITFYTGLHNLLLLSFYNRNILTYVRFFSDELHCQTLLCDVDATLPTNTAAFLVR